MQRIRLLAVVLACAAFGAATASAQGRLEPGEWERSTTTEIPGSYAGPIQDTGRDCYTSADTKIYADKDTWAADMIAATEGPNCKAKDLKQEGTALSVTLVCDEGIRMDIRHDFHGTTGTMDTQMWHGSEKNAKSHVEMKRIAEKCSPETIESWKHWHKGQEFAP